MPRSNVDISSLGMEAIGRKMLRYWWLPLFTLMVALAATWVLSARQQRIYRASTSVIVKPASKITNAREITEVYNTLDRRSVMATLAKTPVTGAIKQQVGVEFEAAHEYEISSVVVPDTNILEISIDGPDPEMARSIADATARQSAVYSAEFYDTFELRVLDPAREARLIRPSLMRNFAVGGTLGLTAGVVIAFLMAYINSVRARHYASKQKPVEKFGIPTSDGSFVDF
jgi:capsular polysaccharide biosynthesis protein